MTSGSVMIAIAERRSRASRARTVMNDSILPDMTQPADRHAEPAETDMTRIYLLVIVVEVITLGALYWMQRVFA